MSSSSRAPSQRQLRVGEELRHMLADVLRRGNLRDPVLAGKSITVSEVRASPDLKSATAFIMPLGGIDTAEILVALKRAAPWLRREIGKRIHLRNTPSLSFQADTSFDEAERIERVLKSPAVARDLEDKG